MCLLQHLSRVYLFDVPCQCHMLLYYIIFIVQKFDSEVRKIADVMRVK